MQLDVTDFSNALPAWVPAFVAELPAAIRLVLAGTGPELEAITTFDEGLMREDWIAQFAARGIEVVDDIDREGAIEVFRTDRAAIDTGQVTVSNARGSAD